MPTTAPTVRSASDEMLAIARHPLVGRIRRTLRDRCGIESGERVIVAVSGGADSLALMLAMAAIAARSRRSGTPAPTIVHVDHRLRPESGADARFVRGQAERLGLSIDVVEVRVGRGNVELAAREARYAALRDAALRHRCTAVLTAHHAEDQLETILMHLCRGCGPEALAGMRWRRPLDDGAPEGVALVRPLLATTRAECREFCRAARRRWRQDRSNRDRSRTRARLRGDVLPVLEALWPGCAVRATAAADRLRAALSTLPVTPTPSPGGVSRAPRADDARRPPARRSGR